MIRGDGDRAPLPKPYLILLDINMPRMNGIELLREIRRDPDHQSALVFVLTTSKDEMDREAAYRYNVAGYLTKSNLDTKFMRVIDMLERYLVAIQFP